MQGNSRYPRFAGDNCSLKEIDKEKEKVLWPCFFGFRLGDLVIYVLIDGRKKWED
jgi:hypothetical protein